MAPWSRAWARGGRSGRRWGPGRPRVPGVGLELPVVWLSRAWSEPEALRLRFVHLAGATRGMDVTWRIEDTLDGCRVTIEHVFAPRVAAWAAFVDGAFTRPIAGRTVATFKALAEALSPDIAADRSE